MMTSAETTKSVARATIYYYSYTINKKYGTIDSNKWKECPLLYYLLPMLSVIVACLVTLVPTHRPQIGVQGQHSHQAYLIALS